MVSITAVRLTALLSIYIYDVYIGRDEKLGEIKKEISPKLDKERMKERIRRP